VKAINLAAKPLEASIGVRGVEDLAAKATKAVLHSKDLSANNSLEEPKHLVPQESTIDNVARQFDHTFLPHSLTVLRIKPLAAD
jgi:alpha-L-arabinofuranosidase